MTGELAIRQRVKTEIFLLANLCVTQNLASVCAQRERQGESSTFKVICTRQGEHRLCMALNDVHFNFVYYNKDQK